MRWWCGGGGVRCGQEGDEGGGRSGGCRSRNRGVQACSRPSRQPSRVACARRRALQLPACLPAPTCPHARPAPPPPLQVRIVKAAEADAEAKFLSGQGIARQRQVRPGRQPGMGGPGDGGSTSSPSARIAGRRAGRWRRGWPVPEWGGGPWQSSAQARSPVALSHLPQHTPSTHPPPSHRHRPPHRAARPCRPSSPGCARACRASRAR